MGFRVDDMVRIYVILERVSCKSTCEKGTTPCRLVVTDVPFEFHPAYQRYISFKGWGRRKAEDLFRSIKVNFI